ncbi:MAG: hypothetical protein WBB45_00025 [Cyclobacteriaceae bacterium]
MKYADMQKIARVLSICILLYIASSCSSTPQEVPAGLFEINKDISCTDLMEQGFAWMPGTDVALFGRRRGDTLHYFQLADKPASFLFGSLLQEQKEEFVERDAEVCDNLRPIWRNIQVQISKQDISSVVDGIDGEKYEVIEQSDKGYSIYLARVVNRETMDTFNFSVYERENEYFVSSTIAF